VYTGALSLFAQPHPVVTLGETGTLYCNSGSTYDLFTLSKQHGEGDFMNCIKQSYNRFHISPRDLQVYGSYKTFPYKWKSSSKPLKLIVTDAAPGNHDAENVVRFALAAMSLVILGVFLVDAWFSRKDFKRKSRAH
ncbi:hypothetical protein EI555_020531, partial [Monodon monoceros]